MTYSFVKNIAIFIGAILLILVYGLGYQTTPEPVFQRTPAHVGQSSLPPSTP